MDELSKRALLAFVEPILNYLGYAIPQLAEMQPKSFLKKEEIKKIEEKFRPFKLEDVLPHKEKVKEEKKDKTTTSGVEKEEGYLSYKGQGKSDYCLECLTKHYSKALGLIEEAIDRSLKEGQGVQDKVREAVKEITAAEDDYGNFNIPALQEKFDDIKRMAREIRKEIWEKRLTTTNTSKEDLMEIRDKLKALNDKVYDIAVTLSIPTLEKLCKGVSDEDACKNLFLEALKQGDRDYKKLAQKYAEIVGEEEAKKRVKAVIESKRSIEEVVKEMKI